MNSEQRDYWFASLEMHMRTNGPLDSLIKATADTAFVFSIGPPRCEHGVVEGGWCQPCNADYKKAQVENE